jgi:hypothetical protein
VITGFVVDTHSFQKRSPLDGSRLKKTSEEPPALETYTVLESGLTLVAVTPLSHPKAVRTGVPPCRP